MNTEIPKCSIASEDRGPSNDLIGRGATVAVMIASVSEEIVNPVTFSGWYLEISVEDEGCVVREGNDVLSG